MMTDVEMTDAEVREQIERADRFIENLRDAIAEVIADQVNTTDQHDQCLQRIAATVDQVPFVTMCNLSNLDAAWRNRMGMTIMSVIEVYLMGAGCGPTLDYADATAFLAEFEAMIETARRRMVQ
jgi:hypothetical protein